ncbi:MAG: primosomal protein DnaI [Bacilli bacterium]|nr:primosomal protein DnaI [Bacilli bacterium]
MQKINSTINNVNDLEYKLKVSFEEAKKDEDFKTLVDSVNLNDDELMKYTSSFEESALEYKNCKNCKGLPCCKNKMTGYCFMPVEEEGMLNFSYVTCRYKKKYLEDTKYLNNVNYIDIPKEIKDAKIKDIYTDDKNRSEVIKWILKYIKDYKKGNIRKGLFLHGNFGCGKTYLISAMFNELAKDNVKSAVVYFPEYLRSLKESFNSNFKDEFKNKYNEVKYAKLLLIDDLGAEGVTSWSRDEILGSLLQYRMQEGLPTFITSNLNLKELEDHLSITTSNKSEKVKAKRIIERVKQLTVDIEMLGENKRN